MARKKKDTPGDDDQALWDEVARTVQPPERLRRAKNRAKDPADDMATLGQAAEKGAARPDPNQSAASRTRPQVTQDDYKKAIQKEGASKTPGKAREIPTKEKRKIEQGRRSIDLTIDLHGLTQDEAYARLGAVLRRAAEDGHRRVVIVTGKGGFGESSEAGDGLAGAGPRRGVLARNVPEWLRTGGLSHLVSAISPAGPRHGGGGALYVTLRRDRKT